VLMQHTSTYGSLCFAARVGDPGIPLEVKQLSVFWQILQIGNKDIFL